MAENEKEKVGFITKASAAYTDKFLLRAKVQLIPGLGGALDTLLSGLGAKYQSDRLQHYIEELDARLQRIENLNTIEPTEPLYDLMVQVFNEVIKTRSEEKRKRFANLIANQVVKQCDWDEAETACRLLGDLTDIDIQVLDLALTIGHRKPPFESIVKVIEGLCPVTISDKWATDPHASRQATDLRPHFSSLSQPALQVICSELVSRGLLRDRGLDYTDRRPMEIFVATDLSQWLMNWITEPKAKIEL